MRRVLGALAVLLISSACGVATRVRPTPVGVVEPEFAVGGPLVNAGAPLPLPLATLGASHGVVDRLSVSAHVHLTALAAFGVPGFDIGATALAVEQDGARPAVSATLRGYAFTDFRTALWPYVETSAAASWRLGERWTPFASVGVMYAFVDQALLWSPGAGAELALGPWTVSGELRWYDPTYRPGGTVVPWIAPGGAGGLGVVFGGRYAF